MDKRDAIDIAIKYANVVKSKYDFVKIILFGSYAKGNFNEDSDIDIAVILKDYTNLIEIQVDLMRLRRKIDSRIEPHPFREKDFDITNPIVNEILKHGHDIKVNVA
jgi:predicted nucleotidyltransferase